VDRLQQDYLGTTKNFKERYRKGIGVLEEIRSGSINKKGLLKNELAKGDLRGLTTKVFRVVSLSIKHKFFLAAASSYLSLQRPCLARHNSFKYTFLQTLLK